MGLFLSCSCISDRMTLAASEKISLFNWLKQHESVFRQTSRSRPAPEVVSSSSRTQVLSASPLRRPPGTASFSGACSPQGYRDGCHTSGCHCQTRQCLVEEESQSLFMHRVFLRGKRNKKKSFFQKPFHISLPKTSSYAQSQPILGKGKGTTMTDSDCSD